MDGLQIDTNNFEMVPFYGSNPAIERFKARLDADTRIVSGSAVYIPFERYEKVLAGISNLQAEPELRDGQVMKEIGMLLSSPMNDVTPPLEIGQKQGQGIVIAFRDGQKRYVPGRLYEAAMNRLSSLKAVIDVQGDTIDDYFKDLPTHTGVAAAADPAVNGTLIQEDSRYSKIIDTIAYLVKDLIYDGWVQQFRDQRDKDIRAKVREDLKKEYNGKTIGQIGSAKGLEDYLKLNYSSNVLEALAKPVEQKEIDESITGRARSSLPVRALYHIMNGRIKLNKEKIDIINGFFRGFFDYIKNNMSRSEFLTTESEVRALGDNKDVQDFFELMYYIPRGQLRLNICQERFSSAVKDKDYLDLDSLNGQDMAMLMKELRAKAEKIKMHSEETHI